MVKGSGCSHTDTFLAWESLYSRLLYGADRGRVQWWAVTKPQGRSLPTSVWDFWQDVCALLKTYSYQNLIPIESILNFNWIECTLTQKGELLFLVNCSPCASQAAAEHGLWQPGFWVALFLSNYKLCSRKGSVQGTRLLGWINSFLANGEFESSLAENICWPGDFLFFLFSIPNVVSGEIE